MNDFLATRAGDEKFSSMVKLYLDIANEIILQQHERHKMGSESRDSTLYTVDSLTSRVFSEVNENSHRVGRLFYDFVDNLRFKTYDKKGEYEKLERVQDLTLRILEEEREFNESKMVAGRDLLENRAPNNVVFKSSLDGKFYVLSISYDSLGDSFTTYLPKNGKELFPSLWQKLSLEGAEAKYEIFPTQDLPLVKGLTQEGLEMGDLTKIPDEKFAQLLLFVLMANEKFRTATSDKIKNKLSDFLNYDDESKRYILTLPVSNLEESIKFLFEIDEEDKRVKSIAVLDGGELREIDLETRIIGNRFQSFFNFYYDFAKSDKVPSKVGYKEFLFAEVGGAGVAAGFGVASFEEQKDDADLSEDYKMACILKVFGQIADGANHVIKHAERKKDPEIIFNGDEHAIYFFKGDLNLIINKSERGIICNDGDLFEEIYALANEVSRVPDEAPTSRSAKEPTTKFATLYDALISRFGNAKEDPSDFGNQKKDLFVSGDEAGGGKYPYFRHDGGLYSIDEDDKVYFIITEEEVDGDVNSEPILIEDDTSEIIKEVMKKNSIDKDGDGFFLLSPGLATASPSAKGIRSSRPGR
jgi:hypothetical protein